MASDITVTVYFSTYNQAEYVREALDSILMQKTTFPFEILAADDCSKDGTQEIILEYQAEHPNLIRTYFTPENVGGCKKLTECIDKGLLRGKYIANLEGDDYWQDENRLQILVDFLEQHPEYSRVSHQRRIINEKGEYLGFDVPEESLNKKFTIKDFLDGKDYPDFGSVFRNYFHEAGDKYHPLLLASRNVCDFQDMFITQDFGPVYIMEHVFGVYRSRSMEGATNYNSITTFAERRQENIRLARAVEHFYDCKYDLSPMIRRNQKMLLAAAVSEMNAEAFTAAREYVPCDAIAGIASELIYLAWRGKRKQEIKFLLAYMTKEEKRGLFFRIFNYAARRIWRKIFGIKSNELLRGYINVLR